MRSSSAELPPRTWLCAPQQLSGQPRAGLTTVALRQLRGSHGQVPCCALSWRRTAVATRGAAQANQLLRPSPWIAGLARAYTERHLAGTRFLAVHIRPFPDACLDSWRRPLPAGPLEGCLGPHRDLHLRLGRCVAATLKQHGLRRVVVLIHPAAIPSTSQLLQQVRPPSTRLRPSLPGVGCCGWRPVGTPCARHSLQQSHGAVQPSTTFSLLFRTFGSHRLLWRLCSWALGCAGGAQQLCAVRGRARGAQPGGLRRHLGNLPLAGELSIRWQLHARSADRTAARASAHVPPGPCSVQRASERACCPAALALATGLLPGRWRWRLRRGTPTPSWARQPAV